MIKLQIARVILIQWGFRNFRINHTVILEDPFDDPPDLQVPDRSPEPTKEQLDVSDRAAVCFVAAIKTQLQHVHLLTPELSSQ